MTAATAETLRAATTGTKIASAPPSVTELLAAAVGAVPGGAERPGQRTMAEAVSAAAESGEHLLVQAGTGTGKSLAYLVPALLVDGPVVVSTATLALQAQLVDHDLPRLADAVEPLLGRRPTFAVLKGRHHYACMAKIDTGFEEEPDTLFDTSPGGGTRWLGEVGRLGKQIQRIQDWALESETGDRDELDPGVDDTAWRQVSMPARECVGATRCPYGPDCFAEASRARAREVDIVVTNHSLLAFDMLAGRHIVPPHTLLIVDEAHELADRVSGATQAELTPATIDRAARRARTVLDAEVTEALTEAGDGMAVALADTAPGRLTNGLPDVLHEALTLLDSATRRCLDKIGDVKADDGDPVRKQQVKTMIGDLAVTAQRLLAEEPHDVAWIEKDERSGRRGRSDGASVVVAPLSVAETLATHLYEDRTVVATSATLALGGKFETIARALGLADHAEAKWRTLDVGSPFAYAKQGILYVAAHLPKLTASGLPDPAARELVELVSALGGRALGLFSSRKAAERAAEVVREKTDLTVLLQGEEALPILVRRFREERASCLFGVMSLWQGVDVPGDACQLVVIDRLPFPRPDEPLAAARAAAVEESGGSGFAAISVPIAAVRLAQGVGRLIRSHGDRGVVAVLDSRLAAPRGYATYLRDSLPPLWYTTKPDVIRGALQRLAAT